MNSKYYVYRFITKGEVVYVGQTQDVYKRFKTHFCKSGHLPNECLDNVDYVEYAEVNTHAEMDIYEIYYIDMFKPKYNQYFKYNLKEKITFKLPELIWNKATKEEIRKTKIKTDIDSEEKDIKDIIEGYLEKYETITGEEVLKLNKYSLNPIQLYPTGAQASRETGIDDGTIYKVLTKQRPYAGGYKWMKLSEWLEINDYNIK